MTFHSLTKILCVLDFLCFSGYRLLGHAYVQCNCFSMTLGSISYSRSHYSVHLHIQICHTLCNLWSAGWKYSGCSVTDIPSRTQRNNQKLSSHSLKAYIGRCQIDTFVFKIFQDHRTTIIKKITYIHIFYKPLPDIMNLNCLMMNCQVAGVQQTHYRIYK